MENENEIRLKINYDYYQIKICSHILDSCYKHKVESHKSRMLDFYLACNKVLSIDANREFCSPAGNSPIGKVHAMLCWHTR